MNKEEALKIIEELKEFLSLECGDNYYQYEPLLKLEEYIKENK